MTPYPPTTTSPNKELRPGLPQGGFGDRSPVKAWAVAWLACVAVAAASTLGGSMLRTQAENSWKSRLSDLTALLAGHSQKILSDSHGTLDSMSDYAKAHDGPPERFERALSSLEAHDFLRLQLQERPMLDVATFVDSHGQVLAFSRQHPAPSINLSERDYFKAQRDNPTSVDFISAPVRNKGNGKWVHYISRRLIDAQGRFMGLALVGISSEGLSAGYDAIGKDLGEGGSVALLRDDFTLLMRWPHRDDLIGRSYPNGSVASLLRDRSTDSSEAFVSTPSAYDAKQASNRLVAARRVDGHPLIVSAVVAESRYLGAWRASCAALGALSVLCMAGILMAGSRLARAERIAAKSHARRSSRASSKTSLALPADGQGAWFDPRAMLAEIAQGTEASCPSPCALRINENAPWMIAGSAPLTRQILSNLMACAQAGAAFAPALELGLHEDGQGKSWGVLSIQGPKGGRLNSPELATAKTLAAHIGGLIHASEREGSPLFECWLPACQKEIS